MRRAMKRAALSILACAAMAAPLLGQNSTNNLLPGYSGGSGPNVSMRCNARTALMSKEGTPLDCSTWTFDGCPSRAISHLIYTRCAVVILESTSYFSQFSVTFR